MASDDRPRHRGLQEVRVTKSSLITKLRENREEHRAIFEEALSGWKEKVTKALEDAYQDALAGKEFRVHFGLERPEDHTEDYDQAITMLEMSLDEELVLTYSEFRQYVMDEWGWHHAFAASTMAYSETARNKFS